MNPRKPVVPVRTLRVPDELWESAQAIAKAREESLSADVLRPALERYVKRHRKLLERDSK